MLSRDLPASTTVVPAGRSKFKKKRKETQADPKRRKGEEEGGRGKKQNPRKTAKKELPDFHNLNPYKNAHPEPTKTQPSQNTELVAQNPPERHAVTKVELRKKTLDRENFFLRRFRDTKRAFLGRRILPKKPRTPTPKFVARNPPKKNLRLTEL